MSKLTILRPDERRAFDKCPVLNKEERQLYFRLDAHSKREVFKLPKPINRIGFVLQLGYFRAMGRFYSTNAFRKRDIAYVKRLLSYKEFMTVDFNAYTSSSYYRHQEKIQSILDWKPYNNESQAQVLAHAQHQAGLQRKPAHIFRHLIAFCWKQQITIPSYTELADAVTEGFLSFEKNTLTELKHHIDSESATELDQLLRYRGLQPHPITTLKSVNQSVRPMDLAQSVAITEDVSEFFFKFETAIQSLTLSDQAVEYYATWVHKARTKQLTDMADPFKSYLHLLAFFKYQYYTRQDALLAAFIKCVSSSLTTARNRLIKHESVTRNARNQAIRNLAKNNRSHRQLLDEIRLVSKLTNATASEKYYKIEHLLEEFQQQQNETDIRILESIENHLLREANNENLYSIMSELSRSLQLRVGSILKILVFNEKESDPILYQAVRHYQEKDGALTKTAPMEFLTPSELGFVYKGDEFNVSLYKYLLFVHVMDAVKSGDLNLKYSFRFKSISDYLICKKDWTENREYYIKAAGLSKYQDIDQVLAELKQTLDLKYEEINHNYQKNNNPYLRVDDQGQIAIKTPKSDYDTSEFNAETLEQGGIVSIQQVMTDINKMCDFGSAFGHMSVKHSKLKPKFNTIAAGIVGLGCNIGLNKLANISLGIGGNTLRNTVNWCFTQRNVTEANQMIVKAINDQVLAKSYIKNTNRLHSSSDGRKVGVGVDSLMATRSFKYFGKDQGVVIYTFTDERQALFHSTVISASDREAPFVIDGLLQNEHNSEMIHSTDEHGWNEAVHGATHLIDATLAPRFKKIGTKTIYGFSSKATYRKKGYKILPSRPIQKNLIIKNWDDILRFMATIKLNHASASQLFKRLSSYAKQNPLYQALKEFGRIIKSIYILTYCNDVELRQDVQKNLNRIELSNKFSHAVFFDNDQEFKVGTKEEQELATTCKVLIQNAIVLWNYLALSELIVKTKDAEAREDLIDSIHRGSILCWRHINLRGTYDFRKQSVGTSRFNMEEIRNLNLG